MKRTKLSNPLIVTKLVLLLVFVLLVRMIEVFDNKQLLILAIIFGFILYSTFNLPDKIEFDDDYMYVIRKDGVREVDLRNVFYIAKTRLSVNNNLYKLKYYYKGTEYQAKFYPSYFSKSLDKFKNLVARKNPKAKVNVHSLF
jgi:hypothetical protein